jgi:hypothetical protein
VITCCTVFVGFRDNIIIVAMAMLLKVVCTYTTAQYIYYNLNVRSYLIEIVVYYIVIYYLIMQRYVMMFMFILHNIT